MSNWTSGRAHPDAVSCAKMAEITGIPLARVLGIVGETRAVSREEKAVWRRLAGAAATVVLALSALPVWAQTPTSGASEQGWGVCIMRTLRRLNGRLRRALRREAWGHTVAA